MRCCPMTESHFILELKLLHIRGGCSPIIVFFVHMLVGTCCFAWYNSDFETAFSTNHYDKVQGSSNKLTFDISVIWHHD